MPHVVASASQVFKSASDVTISVFETPHARRRAVNLRASLATMPASTSCSIRATEAASSGVSAAGDCIKSMQIGVVQAVLLVGGWKDLCGPGFVHAGDAARSWPVWCDTRSASAVSAWRCRYNLGAADLATVRQHPRTLRPLAPASKEGMDRSSWDGAVGQHDLENQQPGRSCALSHVRGSSRVQYLTATHLRQIGAAPRRRAHAGAPRCSGGLAHPWRCVEMVRCVYLTAHQ